MTPGVSGGSSATNDAAFQSFNSQAQRHTRPAEPGYTSGGDGGVTFNANGAGNAYANASVQNHIVLNIPAGSYDYTWNKFGKGIAYLNIVGAGSGSTSLRNVGASGNFHNDIPYDGAFDYFGDAFYSGYDDYGWLINTANVGDTSVVFKNSSTWATAAGQFKVGRWVLIMSYSQQWYGYPPNMRYYDWAKVTGINAGTGTITIDTPLTFQHLSTRPFDGGTLMDHSTSNEGGINGQVGPARIVAIDLPVKPIGYVHNYSGFHVLTNPNWDTGALGDQTTAGVWTLQGLIDGTTSDVVADNALAMFMLHDHTISNSTWVFDEADKIVHNLTYNHDTLDTTRSHSGELEFHVIGGHIGNSNVAARTAIYDSGLIVDGMMGPSGAYDSQGINMDADGQTISVSIDGVQFNGNNQGNNAPISGPQQAPYTFTVGSDGLLVVTGPNGAGTRLQIAASGLDTVNSVAERIVDTWGDGDGIIKNGSLVSGAQITSITGDATNIYVDVSGTTFANGDTVVAPRVTTLSVMNSIGSNTGYNWTSQATWPFFQYIESVTWSGNSGN